MLFLYLGTYICIVVDDQWLQACVMNNLELQTNMTSIPFLNIALLVGW